MQLGCLLFSCWPKLARHRDGCLSSLATSAFATNPSFANCKMVLDARLRRQCTPNSVCNHSNRTPPHVLSPPPRLRPSPAVLLVFLCYRDFPFSHVLLYLRYLFLCLSRCSRSSYTSHLSVGRDMHFLCRSSPLQDHGLQLFLVRSRQIQDCCQIALQFLFGFAPFFCGLLPFCASSNSPRFTSRLNPHSHCSVWSSLSPDILRTIAR